MPWLQWFSQHVIRHYKHWICAEKIFVEFHKYSGPLVNILE